MTPFHVRFGVGLGDFLLGSHISEFLHFLSKDYPRLKIEIISPSVSDIFKKDILIDIKELGILFHFLAKTQRLYLIDVYDIYKADFAVKGECLGKSSKSQSVTTFATLQKCLEPSFPGNFIDETDYLLHYNGAALMFIIPLDCQQGIDKKNSNTAIPVYLSNGTSPVLSRIYIFPEAMNLLKPDLFPDDVGMLDAHSRGSGGALSATSQSQAPQQWSKPTENFRVSVVLQWPQNNESKHLISYILFNEVEILCGMTPQDIQSILGRPTTIALCHHCTTGTTGDAETNSSMYSSPYRRPTYRYCYTMYGIDLYFDASRHQLFSIMLLNNLPIHHDFGMFNRCPFRIEMGSTGDDKVTCKSFHYATPWSSTTAAPVSMLVPDSAPTTASKKSLKGVAVGSDKGAGSGNIGNAFDACACGLDYLSMWFGKDNVHRSIGQAGPANKQPPPHSSYNPTLLYAFPEMDVLFEVLPPPMGGAAVHSWITAVTIFQPQYLSGGGNV